MSTQQTKINAFDSEKYKWGKNGPQKYAITVGAMNAIAGSLGTSTLKINELVDGNNQLATSLNSLSEDIGAKVDQHVADNTYATKASVSDLDSKIDSVESQIQIKLNDKVGSDEYSVKISKLETADSNFTKSISNLQNTVDSIPNTYATINSVTELDNKIDSVSSIHENLVTKETLQEKLSVKLDASAIDQLATKNELNEANNRTDNLDEKKLDIETAETTYATKDEVSELPHFTKFVAGADPSERKTIQLANHDSISGITSTGDGANLIMMSKWDVVDIGSSKYPCGLNAKDGVVTINDKFHVATTESVEDSIDKAKTTLETNLGELSDRVMNIDGSITSISSDINSIKANIENIQTNVTDKVDKSDLSDTKDTLDLVQSELNNKATVAELKKQVEALHALLSCTMLSPIISIDQDSTDIDQPNTVVNTTSNFDGTKATDQSVPAFTITGKIVAMSSNKANNCKLIVTGLDGVSLQGVSTNGVDYSKINSTVGNDPVKVSSAETVIIDGLTWITRDAGYGYNAVSVGFNDKNLDVSKMVLPKKIVIRNLDLTAGEFKNNPIGIYGFDEGAEILIENCKFGLCSNPIRISNIANKSATITIKNCSIDQCYYENDSENYRGFMLLQDYSKSGYKEFASKLTINFENCYAASSYSQNDLFNHFGLTTAHTSNSSELMIGDKNAFLQNHWIYVYRDHANTGDGAQAGIITDLDQWPTITAK